MALFEFQSPRRERISPAQWVARWSARFDTDKFPEDVYRELVEKGLGLSERRLRCFRRLEGRRDKEVTSSPRIEVRQLLGLVYRYLECDGSKLRLYGLAETS